VCTIDLAASLAALTGIPLEAESCLDSQDVLGALLGKAGSRGRSHLVQQNNLGNGVFGYRSGPWKLLRHDSQRATNTVVEGPLTTTRVPRLQLFRIDEDPAEKNNLFEQFPGEAERMNRELEGIIAAGRSRQGKSNVRVASQGTFSEINGPESAAPQQGAP
jgi:arylsulfatase A